MKAFLPSTAWHVNDTGLDRLTSVRAVLGDLPLKDDQPSTLTLYYYDVLSRDTNKDPEGRIHLTRRPIE